MRAWVRWLAVLGGWACLCGAARAELVVGVTLALSGPAAPIGQAQRRVVDHLPTRIGGEAVRYEVLDDGSEPARALANAIELVDGRGAAVVIGTTTVAGTLAMAPALAARQTVLITPSAAAPDAAGDARWLFRTLPELRLMANAAVAHMHEHGVRRVAWLGDSNAYAQQWGQWLALLAELRGIEIVASETLGRSADAVAAAAAGVAAQGADAVVIAAAGSAGIAQVNALRQAGFGGRIYQTQAVALDQDLSACAMRCEGLILPASPGRVAQALPADSAIGAAARTLAGALGVDSVSAFDAAIWDAGRLVAAAAPRAWRTSPVGSAAFRRALRDTIEGLSGVAGANGFYQFSGKDHSGLDQRAVVMVEVARGHWKPAQ